MKPDFITKKLQVAAFYVRLEIMLAHLGVPREKASSRASYMLEAHGKPEDFAVVPGKLEFTVNGDNYTFVRSHAISLDLAEKIAKRAYKTTPKARAAVLRRIGEQRAKLQTERQGELPLFDKGEVPRVVTVSEESRTHPGRPTWLERAQDMLLRVPRLEVAEAIELERHLALADRLGIPLTHFPALSSQLSESLAQPEAVSSPVFELVKSDYDGPLFTPEWFADLLLTPLPEVENQWERLKLELTELCYSARALWERLDSKRQFTDWWADFKKQLVEGKDYVIFHANVKNTQAGRPGSDYLLTADAVKIICILSRSPFGDEVRRYFLHADRVLRGLMSELISQLKAEKELEKNERRSVTDKHDELKVQYTALEAASRPALVLYDALENTAGLTDMKLAAAILTGALGKDGGRTIGHNHLMEMLRRDGHLLTGKHKAEDMNCPSRDMLESGRMRVHLEPHAGVDAKKRTPVPYFTDKGLKWLVDTYCPMPERHRDLLRG
jgi:phage anti-repressor protein/phage antirepressor YoqD-like protein